MFAVNRTFHETSMLLQRATVDPNLRAFDQTTGRGTDKIRLNVKQAIRVQYDNKCAFCGVSQSEKGLSCAHLASREGYFTEGYHSKFDIHSPRNYLLLCGSHGVKGTCHDGFDSHKLALIPSVGLRPTAWTVLSCYEGWKNNRENEALPQMHQPYFTFNSKLVYRRALATRLHKFFLDNRPACDKIPQFVDTVGAKADLSKTESLRESACLVSSEPTSEPLASDGSPSLAPPAGLGVVVPPRKRPFNNR